MSKQLVSLPGHLPCSQTASVYHAASKNLRRRDYRQFSDCFPVRGWLGIIDSSVILPNLQIL